MTDTAFWIRILLSFLIAGSWISLASLLAARLGSRLGGLIANLPSNIIVTMIFISLTRGDQFAAQAAASVPLGMAIDMVFLFAFMLAAGRGPLLAVPLSLLVWAACAILALIMPQPGFWGTTAIFALVSLGLFLVAEFPLKIRAVPKRETPASPLVFLIRAVFSGSVVAAAVAASAFAPAYLTGIIATFPAVLLSTLTILTISQGAAFSRATGKVLLLSSSNIIVYAFAVQALFPLIGRWWGSLAAFAAAALWVTLLRPLLAKAR
ncbi:MAG: DUF3147 family protein [Spirochaetes bacterium]|nr:DUF3147 family protein [Spirochaetota bacterium]MBU0955565.1 DUF3147 family protein [Spirochaetota bacterium]